MSTPSAAAVIALAKTQIGVHEGRDKDGSWNNDQKYSDETPGFDWSDGQPWCDTFVAWCSWKSGFTEDQWPRSASCDASGSAFKKMGRWSEYPAIGAQVFFGTSSDLQHTGIVTKYDDTYVWTVEGNTNSSGSYQGDGVYAKMHERRDARLIGYGYPKFPEGVVSADPAWQKKPPTPATHGFVVDYSFARPDPKALKAAGFAGVVRYISNGSGKDLTAAEAAKLHAAGLWVALVWETTASRATEGAAAGAADVKAAEAAADRLGYPKGAVIFYAVDTDAQPDAVRPYFAAVKKGASRPVGVYGGVRVIDAQLAPHAWQTEAWSAGQVSAHADMLQRIHATKTVKGAPDGWDENVLIAERAFPVWSPTKPQPTPVPDEADFYVGEISGLWDADVEVWKQAIADQVYAGATVILITETTIDGLMRQVCPPGWDFARLDAHPGESECTVMWKTSARKSAAKAYATVLADTQFYTGKGHLRTRVTSVTKALKDLDSGDVDLFTAFHAPSGDTDARERAHQETLAAIPEAWDQGREEFPDAGRVLGFDLNRDMRRDEVRQAWGEAFPMLELCWTADNLPNRGTHGNAVIDGVAAGKGRLRIVSVRVLPTVKAPPGKKPFDHRSILIGIARVPHRAA